MSGRFSGTGDAGSSRVRRALVVDDHDDARRLFVILLATCGWVCEEAGDGAEAVRRGASSAYDLILMDLRMPVLSGVEAIRQLRGMGVTTKILAVTADAFASAREQALGAGADGYLAKPVTRAALLEQCESMLAARE